MYTKTALIEARALRQTWWTLSVPTRNALTYCKTLDQAINQLEKALADPQPTGASVRSTGRVGKVWALSG
jgi:hypothetical protein